MLSEAENEYATRTNAGTPMGQFIRRFWMPALLSAELPEPDCAPLRLKLLGENLVAFRDSNGTVGMLAENCPHRGASLFFGRNEEAGLRCVYHGWKFDETGQCIDMPNEPAESEFKTRVRAVAYPTEEKAGVVWAYLGPPQKRPPQGRDPVGSQGLGSTVRPAQMYLPADASWHETQLKDALIATY
jgi:phthalate 4,5-dioxygenase oxygenase subunit